ncbi:hypothetical protein ERO13_D08G124350v2 [Gossypium hirsutum]|nr:hypothetical protein ERO13_D08G124350v2 [Gossypium hirsutum]
MNFLVTKKLHLWRRNMRSYSIKVPPMGGGGRLMKCSKKLQAAKVPLRNHLHSCFYYISSASFYAETMKSTCKPYLFVFNICILCN